MTGHRITLKGYRIDKNGKLVRNARRLSAGARSQQRASKDLRVKRRAT